MEARRTRATPNAPFRLGIVASTRLPPGSLLGRIFRRLLFAPGATKHVDHGIVALVTGVLVKVIRYRHESRLCCPGSCKRRRVVDREPVENRIRADAREPFDHVQVLTGSPEPGLAGEISRVYHQRVALPVANRISHPPADV